jgi:hypothetical protein
MYLGSACVPLFYINSLEGSDIFRLKNADVLNFISLKSLKTLCLSLIITRLSSSSSRKDRKRIALRPQIPFTNFADCLRELCVKYFLTYTLETDL